MKIDRTAEASQVAKALGLSSDSIGRYARAGRIPFATTPGKHRRFNIDEVRQALDEAPQVPVFGVPSATLRRRQRRAVVPPVAAVEAAAASHTVSAAIEDLMKPAKRVLRASVSA